MKGTALAIAISAAAAVAAVAAFPPGATVIWNRTESAPKGIYLITKSEIKTGDWAALSGESETAKWIAENGYLRTDWPIIKRVAASEGDEICRTEEEVFINKTLTAIALDADSAREKLPRWKGCITLQADQVFLLNNHPRSLDGRYFGAENRKDLLGRARLLFRVD
ncbi:S26 family signal peptidase [Hyphococcus sp.]|uniref:S26 family signal peptidase n=1 Tax=Hyphococcus sp. TaxID=2038636 RepID=UPI003D09B00E